MPTAGGSDKFVSKLLTTSPKTGGRANGSTGVIVGVAESGAFIE